jgi:hypothetical protein
VLVLGTRGLVLFALRARSRTRTRTTFRTVCIFPLLSLAATCLHLDALVALLCEPVGSVGARAAGSSAGRDGLSSAESPLVGAETSQRTLWVAGRFVRSLDRNPSKL